MPCTVKPLRVRVERGFTLLLASDGRLLYATVAEHPRVRVKASSIDLALRRAREGVRWLEQPCP